MGVLRSSKAHPLMNTRSTHPFSIAGIDHH